jgi:argininosuccinate lyase
MSGALCRTRPVVLPLAFAVSYVLESKGLSPVFQEDITQVFDFEASVQARSAQGRTVNNSVLFQIEKMMDYLKNI